MHSVTYDVCLRRSLVTDLKQIISATVLKEALGKILLISF